MAYGAAVNTALGGPPADYFDAGQTGHSAFVKRALEAVTEPNLKQALLDYATTTPAFTVTAAQVTALNAAVAALPPGAESAAYGAAVNTALGGPPANYFDAGQAGAVSFIQFALSKIAERPLRVLLLQHLVTNSTFNPTASQVVDLNRHIATLPERASAHEFQNAVVAAFAGTTAAPTLVLFTPAAGAAVATYHVTLAAVKEPVLRGFLQTSNSTFTPTARHVTALNKALDELSAPATTAAFAAALQIALTSGAPAPAAPAPPFAAADFEPGGPGRAAYIQHVLSRVIEKNMREALQAYAKATPGFDPTPAQVATLNKVMALVPKVVTAAQLDESIQKVFPTASSGLPPTYFQSGVGATLSAGIIEEHRKVQPLYAIKTTGVRDALIKEVTVTGSSFEPTEDEVLKLRREMDRIDTTDKTAASTAIDSHVNRIWAGKVAVPRMIQGHHKKNDIIDEMASVVSPRRATYVLQKKPGSIFQDEVIKQGDASTYVALSAPPAGVVVRRGVAAKIEYVGVDLKTGDTLRSTATFQTVAPAAGVVLPTGRTAGTPAKGILEQGADGTVKDLTTDSLTSLEAQEMALRHAEILLSTYDPKKDGPLVIEPGCDPEQGNRVVAALLLLTSNRIEIISQAHGVSVPNFGMLGRGKQAYFDQHFPDIQSHDREQRSEATAALRGKFLGLQTWSLKEHRLAAPLQVGAAIEARPGGDIEKGVTPGVRS